MFERDENAGRLPCGRIVRPDPIQQLDVLATRSRMPRNHRVHMILNPDWLCCTVDEEGYPTSPTSCPYTPPCAPQCRRFGADAKEIHDPITQLRVVGWKDFPTKPARGTEPKT